MSALGVLITLLAWVAIIFLVALGSIATVACAYEVRRLFRRGRSVQRAERLVADQSALAVAMPDEWQVLNPDDRTWLAGYGVQA